MYPQNTCITKHICKHKRNKIRETQLMTTTAFISVTNHVVIAGIYNYLLSQLSLYFFCLQQAHQLVMVLDFTR